MTSIFIPNCSSSRQVKSLDYELVSILDVVVFKRLFNLNDELVLRIVRIHDLKFSLQLALPRLIVL